MQSKFNTPNETIPFNKISNADFLPALKSAIEDAKKKVEKLKNNGAPATFENTCAQLDRVNRKVGLIGDTFFNLHGADTNEERQKLAKEISPILTQFSNDLSLDEKLFHRIKAVYDNKQNLELNSEQETLLNKQYKGFVRNGALLNATDKEKLRSIDKRLDELTLQFSENNLEERKLFELWITDKKDLAGLPESALKMAKHQAEKKGKPDQWFFNLDFPMYFPLITYAQNRELRKKIFLAYSSVGIQNNQYDNRTIILEIVKLRKDRANLLGFDTHATYVLAERMAETPDKVTQFLLELLDKAKPFAAQDIQALEKFAKEVDGITDFRRGDVQYYTEKLKKKLYDLDDEMLRPYFKLENVIEGAFLVATKLYGLKFTHNKNIETYHPDVKAYEVFDSENSYVGVFYADFFPRPGKRSGAWMTDFRVQSYYNEDGSVFGFRPHVVIVCNFTPSTPDQPSLLGLDEVLTLFHEFGHALHGLLSDVKYDSLAGTNVYWDFVELPSQIMENWVYEKECLDLFARHYKTNELMPAELITKIRKSSNFQEGRMTLRQLGFSLLDMAWHQTPTDQIKSVEEFEKEILGKIEILPLEQGTNMSSSFSHIFSGGYDAGYYSYKWAEVLDADAFQFFKENGIFNTGIADKFRKNILSQGGSQHPMELYQQFRGQPPSIEALLKRSGLISNL